MASYRRMKNRRSWFKGQSERGHMTITNLFLQDIPMLAAKTACPDAQLRLEKSFEVNILTRNQWIEDGGTFSDDLQIWLLMAQGLQHV